MVCGAHVQSVGGSGAELPCRVQRVQLVVLAHMLLRVGVVTCEALVDVAVVDDGLGGVSVRGGSVQAKGSEEQGS